MIGPECLRCGERPADPGDWLYCEPCWQAMQQEAHDALADQGEDAISVLMLDGGLSFPEAVECLARKLRG